MKHHTFMSPTSADLCSPKPEMHQRYEQAGADVQESLSGWAKQQEAALAEDQDSLLQWFWIPHHYANIVAANPDKLLCSCELHRFLFRTCCRSHYMIHQNQKLV